MAQTDQVKEEILNKADIAEIVSQYVQLKQRGGRLFGLCPFHKEKTPSFSVNPENQFFHCFGCGKGGNVFDFVMGVENLTFPEAKRFLANKLGIRYEEYSSQEKTHREIDRYQVMDHAAQLFANWLQSDEAAKAYVLSRGISEQDMRQYGLGYAPNAWDSLRSALLKRGFPVEVQNELGLIIPRQSGEGYYDRFRHRIMFPIRNTLGRVIAFGGRALNPEEPAKYLNSNETSIFNKSKTLYLLDRAKHHIKEKGVVIVEGYMDAIALHMRGFQQAVATLGTALTKEHLSILKRYTNSFTVLYDGDNAGVNAANRGVETCFDAGMAVRIALLPEGEDPDDFLKKRGAEELQLLLDSAWEGFDFYLSRIVKQHDPTTPKGKAEIVREMIPLLTKVSETFIRKDYIRLLTQRIGSEVHLVEDYVQRAVRKAALSSRKDGESAPAPPPAVKEADKGLTNLKKALIRLLAYHQGLFTPAGLNSVGKPRVFSETDLQETIPSCLESLQEETLYDRLLAGILQRAAAAGNTAAAQLASIFPDAGELSAFISVTEAEPLPTTEKGFQKLYRDVMDGLRLRAEKKRRKELMIQANGDYRAAPFREIDTLLFARGRIKEP
ncbi:MAG: DNA primase [Candidatus Omnitrophota bacterium]|jgi:DNA primase|nr:MAG: DNA primase [Candidatus Omnitrophota bacterium]